MTANTAIKRIGFCCKYLDSNGETVPDKNYRGTTVAWLNRQSKDVAEQRLWDIMEHNVHATFRVVTEVGSMEPSLRMMRLGSDMLPVYTEPTWSYFWRRADVIAFLERELAKVGELARKLDVRLSFHPGQYCVLVSASDDIVTRSIDEFEYHVDMARWMGYGTTWHDHGFKINVHLSGRRGADGIIHALGRMSTEARNLITIENDEMTAGIDNILALENHVALVLDLHHHWVHSASYLDTQDDRVQRIVNSWRGTRPTLHYSVSREDLLIGHPTDTLPNRELLKSQGHKIQKLRAHSDMMWNTAVNDYALSFLPQFDIQVEAKHKNLASTALYRYYTNL